MSYRFSGVLIVFFFLAITLIVFSVPLLLSFSLLSSQRTEISTNHDLFTYQSQEVSHSLSILDTGTIELNQKLLPNEFLTYHDEESSSLKIISNFASRRYECHGTCTCSSNSRRTTNILAHPLFLLISATSTSLALKMAQDSFRVHCLHKISATCDEEIIEAEVTHCSESVVEKSDVEYANYQCTGHCEQRTFHDYSAKIAMEEFEEVLDDCDQISTPGFVRAPLGDIAQAIEEFRKVYLIEFCKQETTISYIEWKEVDGEMKDLGDESEDQMCTGEATNTKKSNIKCDRS